MHQRVPRWSVPLLAVALAGALAALPGAASALTSPAPTPAALPDAGGLPRPGADDPARRGAVAPIGGVVPGLTGAAAQAAAGAAADHFRETTRRRLGQATGGGVSPLAQRHTHWGVLLPASQGQGLHVTQSIIPGTSPTHGGDYVYAPTALPAGNACIEMTTAYTPSGPKLWAWDWCGGRDDVGKAVNLDATFLATYTTTVDGRPSYSFDEHQTNAATNTWTSYLYNYVTHAWDTFYTSSGTYDLTSYTYGWNIFEIYTSVNSGTGAGYYCGDLAGKGFESSAAEIFAGGAWTAVTPSNSRLSHTSVPPGSSYDCPSLTFNLVHPNDHWLAQIGGGASSSSSSSSRSSSSSSRSSGSSSRSSGSSGTTGACTAVYRLTNSWQGGFQGEVTVTAGSAPLNGWTVRLTLPSGSSISQAWNGVLSGGAPTYAVTNQSYNGALAAGASTTFGFLGSGASGTPTLSCASP